MKFFTVATKPKYNSDQANRFFEQLQKYYHADFELYCYTDDTRGYHKDINVIEIPKRDVVVERQWNKIDFFSNNFDVEGEPIIVSDLDWTFLSDVTDILDTPVHRGEFVAVRRWWYMPSDTKYTINGGMYKFIAGDVPHVYDEFYKNPAYWQQHYIKIGKTPGPVNGEQNFVKDMVDNTHKIKFFEPFDAIGRLPTDNRHFEEYNLTYMMRSSSRDFFYMDGEFNPKIRMIHSIM